jgi:hypothetical protein
MASSSVGGGEERSAAMFAVLRVFQCFISCVS